jgi:hypothetical protein
MPHPFPEAQGSEPVLEPFLQVIWRSSRSGKQLDLLGAWPARP